MENDNQQLLEQITALNSKIDKVVDLYEKELQRESDERDLQATRDSEQVEMANAEALVKEADEALEAEAQAKEKQEADAKADENQKNLISAIGAVESKVLSGQVTDQQVIDEISISNQKLSELIEIQNGGTAISASNNQLGTMAVAGLIIAIGAFAVFKAGGFVVSKITQILW